MPMFISKYLSVSKVNCLLIIMLVLYYFKYFCSTCMVLVTLSIIVLSSLKLFHNALRFSYKHILLLNNVHNITFFVLRNLKQICQVFRKILLYHYPWQHSALRCVLFSVAAYSNGRIFSGLLVIGLIFPSCLSN